MSSQLTIQRPVQTEGIGLHTAVRSRVRFLPAPADTGIVFRRVDLDNFEIEAHVRNVARVSYATSLMKQGVLLSTTEHVLAALYSCGVDNVFVEIDALELPILDGSAKPFIDLLAQAGIKQLRRQRRYIKVIKPLEFTDGDRLLVTLTDQANTQEMWWWFMAAVVLLLCAEVWLTRRIVRAR